MTLTLTDFTNRLKVMLLCNTWLCFELQDSLVMPRPNSSHQWMFNKAGLPVVDVVVDPYIANNLRQHQKEGLIFLYECVMGMR